MLWLRALSTAVALLVSLSAGEDSCPAGAAGRSCTAAPGPKAMASAKAKADKAPASVSADLLTQEVGELRSVVKLCEERIELLTEMKGMVASQVKLPLPASNMRLLKEPLPMMADVALDVDKAATGSADDYYISKAAISLESPASFIKILTMKAPRTSSSKDSSPSAAAANAMPSALVVAAQADGVVRLFAPAGDLVLSFNAGHDHPLLSLAVSPSHDEHFVTTADAGGIIRVHKINIRQRRLAKDEKHRRRNSTDEKVSQFLGSAVNATHQFTHQMQIPAASDGKPATLTSLTIASQQGQKYFVAGDMEGKLNIFRRNGTLWATLNISKTPVVGLYSHLSNLIFYDETRWGYVNFEKKEVLHMDCAPFQGPITAAVFDSQQGARLLVADVDGTIWALNVKEKRSCKVEHRFPKGATLAPLSLASIRGFTLGLEKARRSGDEASVVAINMSHVGKIGGTSGSVVWRKGKQAVRDWAVHKRQSHGDLIAILSEDGLQIELAEVLMSVYTAPTTTDFGDYQKPMIAVGVLLVLGYQYMKNKGGKGKGGGGAKLGGGAMDMHSGGVDFGALKNRTKKTGLAGLGSGLAGLKNRRK